MAAAYGAKNSNDVNVHGPGDEPRGEDGDAGERSAPADPVARAQNAASTAGSGRRMRTPPPPAFRGELEDPQPSGGPGAEALKETLGQFRYIQDLLHNPIPFDLRRKSLDTSTSPEELASRKAELRYQTEVLQALLKVLTEELEQLERVTVRSAGSPSQDGPDQS